MHAYGPEILDPVFHFLDRLIHDYGDILYMGLVYTSIPLIAWILSGGLRRKPSRPVSATPLSIIVIRPPSYPPPLPPTIIGSERDPGANEDGDSFAA
jgi:hypothetical protein